MNDDDDSKKLPRARWTSEDARAKETKRVSQLLDAEGGQRNDAPPADPEPADVYGLPTDPEEAPVYGAPEDVEPSRPVATRVYGMPAPVYGMPATRRPVVTEPPPAPAKSRFAPFIIGGIVAAAAVLWWFSR